jgi:hypothetical protein
MATTARILRARCAFAALMLFALPLACSGWCDTASAQTATEIVRVEEEWELIVATPDPNSDSPQVTCVISPLGHTQSLHAAFEMNYQSLPEFVPGGLQLQLWNGEEPLASRKFPNGSVMQQQDETVRWKQCLELANGLLTFEITGGTSAAWGAFGGQGYLKASVPTTLENLNGYNPAVSVNNSGVGYAANRVQSLVLRKVRLVTSGGEILEAEPQYSVYPRQ